MKRHFFLLMTLCLSTAALAQEAPRDKAPEPPLDADTTIRRADPEEDTGAVASTTRAYRSTRSALKRMVEGEQANRELEEIDLIEARPLHPEDRLHLKALRYLVKKRAALREEAKGAPNESQKEAIEDLDDEIEKVYEAMGRDPFIRLRSSGLGILRVDHRRNRDFNRRVDDNDTFVPLRIDLGFEIGLESLGRFVVMGTFSETFDADRRADDLSDEPDLFMAYYEPHFLRGDRLELTPRIGRQVLRYGNQRILGDDAFSVFHRSFDAARLDLKARGLELSAFAGQRVVRADLSDASLNESSDDEQLFGTYNALTFGKSLRVELYGLRKRIDRPGIEVSKIDTFGSRVLMGNGEGIGLELEGIVQTGRLNGANHRAFAGAAAVTYTRLFDQLDEDLYEHIDPRVLAKANAAVRAQVRLGIDWAQGDDDPFDGKSGTFQPVYPSQHDFQGEADVLGFQNVIDLHAAIAYTWRGEVDEDGPSSFGVRAAYHYFLRDTNQDAAYDFNGVVIAPGNGFGSREIGHELDVRMTFFDSVSIGWARFFPGEFLRGSGRDDPVDYFYLSFH